MPPVGGVGVPLPRDEGSCPLSTVPSDAVFFPPWLQDYYSGGYYPAQDPALGPPQEISPDASFIDDEAVS